MPAIPGYAHLAQDANHCGGAPRIADFGIRVAGILKMYQSGMTPVEIREWYGDVPLGAIFAALAYANDHAEEMKQHFENEDASNEVARGQQSIPPRLRAALEQTEVLS